MHVLFLDVALAGTCQSWRLGHGVGHDSQAHVFMLHPHRAWSFWQPSWSKCWKRSDFSSYRWGHRGTKRWSSIVMAQTVLVVKQGLHPWLAALPRALGHNMFWSYLHSPVLNKLLRTQSQSYFEHQFKWHWSHGVNRKLRSGAHFPSENLKSNQQLFYSLFWWLYSVWSIFL